MPLGGYGRLIRAPWHGVRRSFKAKLILSFFAIVSLTLLLTGSIYYVETSRDIERSTIANLERNADRTVTTLEIHMENIQNEAWNYFSDSDFQVFVENMSGIMLTEKTKYYQNKLAMSKLRNSVIGMIGVYDLNGSEMVIGRRYMTNEERSDAEEEKQTLIELALQNDGMPIWMLTRSFAESSNRTEHTLSFVQALKKISTFSQKLVGVLHIEMKTEMLKGALRDLNLIGGHGFVILDENGRIIAAEDDAIIGRSGSEWLIDVPPGLRAGHVKTNVQGKPAVNIFRKFHDSGWMLVGSVWIENILVDINRAGKRTLWIGLLILAALMVPVWWIAGGVTKPLRKLREHMRQVERGNFDAAVPVRSLDEIGALSLSFNKMVREIHRLINKVYEAELLKKDAEIVALQSQINPHFLYNALGMIDSLASIEGNEQICRISQSLSSMFRYSIKGGQFSTLQAEIDQSRLFLEIHRFRFGERLSYEIRIEPGLKRQKMPKLVLQPIVENAVKHGIEPLREGGRIELEARTVSADRLMIRIRDNGGGCGEQQVRHIDSVLRSVETTPGTLVVGRNQIGLENVYRRLRLCFGDRADMTFRSSAGTGTTVTLHLPIEIAGRDIDAESARCG
jgi:two-component system sensor histidine kinase YesM